MKVSQILRYPRQVMLGCGLSVLDFLDCSLRDGMRPDAPPLPDPACALHAPIVQLSCQLDVPVQVDASHWLSRVVRTALREPRRQIRMPPLRSEMPPYVRECYVGGASKRAVYQPLATTCCLLEAWNLGRSERRTSKKMACCLKKSNLASRLEKKNELLPSLRIVGTGRSVGRSVSRIVRCKSQTRQEGVENSVLPGEIGAVKRCLHGSTSQPLFRDDAACVLAREAVGAVRPETALGEAVVTRFVDDLVSRAVGEQEVNQIVLVGTGMDTRPYRLPWGPGTMFFEVGPAECLRTSERLLKEAGIRPPRGVLHRRVPAGLQSADGSWYGSLAKAGYRGDRPSIWVVTGLADLDLSAECYDAVLENISSGMMLDSFVVGELPSTIDGNGPVESLASWDVLAMSTRFADAIAEYGIACSEEEASECIKRGVLIRGKQTKLSRHQCRVYSTHTSQLESDADEDYFDNVV